MTPPMPISAEGGTKTCRTEAGFFPGIILYLSYWCPAHRRAAITSLFMAAVPISVGFFNAIPPTVAVIAMYLWSWPSDRQNELTRHVVVACLAAAVGLALAGISNTAVAVTTSLVLVNVGISAAKPPLWSMPTLFPSGPAAATGIAAINSIGNLGGFIGSAMIGWIKDLTGSFLGGLYFVSGLLLVSAALTVMVARSLQRPATATVAAHS